MKQITLISGEKDPAHFKQEILDAIRSEDRMLRFRMLKMYRDGHQKEYPNDDWKNVDRNKMYRVVAESGFWNVTMVVLAVWDAREFPEIY
ncbi:hypothetical protein ACRHK7_01260 [Weissella tructae]|uniref:hypothetical protein n=1 Tax=Weissella tructae TaxID=887702 RepID=UPI003D9501A9